MPPTETDSMRRAREFVERVMIDAEAQGITSVVIGGSVHADGHDGWFVNARGPCLSVVGLIGELRDWVEHRYFNVRYESPKKPWWKSWISQRNA